MKHVCLVAAGIVLMAGCSLDGSPEPVPHNRIAPRTLVPEEPAKIVLPDDIISDVVRPDSPQASFASYVSVDVRVRVLLFRSADGRDTSVGTDEIFLIATDPDGNLLMFTRATAEGDAHGAISLPTDLPSIVLSLVGVGYGTRTVTIDEPSTLVVIDRSMGLKLVLDGGPSLLVSSWEDTDGDGTPDILDDTDGDGVTDNYDMFPRRPNFAVEVFHPTQGTFTVGFEDLYPNAGDADFNDFLARYTISERRLLGPLPLQILGEFEALARAAGYNHEFGIVIRFPNRTATLEISRYDSQGVLLGEPETYVDLADAARIVIFPETRDAFDRPDGASPNLDNGASGPTRGSKGHVSSFTLTFDRSHDPEEFLTRQGLEQLGYVIDDPPYDPYLLVHNTGYDLHLVGESSLPEFPLQGFGGSINPLGPDGFVDAAGYPRGLLVPEAWAQPKESVHITLAYPLFESWMTDEEPYSMYRGWYHLPVQDNVVVFDDES